MRNILKLVVGNFHIVVVSIVAMTLFVLLVYPAIVPVNAPPHLKTFKDLFLAFAVLALLALFVLTARVNAVFAGQLTPIADPADEALALFCSRRC